MLLLSIPYLERYGGLPGEDEPRHERAHEGAMQEIDWEANFAKPEEGSSAEQPPGMWRNEDGEDQYEAADGAPGAAEVALGGEEALADVVEETGPAG